MANRQHCTVRYPGGTARPGSESVVSVPAPAGRRGPDLDHGAGFAGHGGPDDAEVAVCAAVRQRR